MVVKELILFVKVIANPTRTHCPTSVKMEYVILESLLYVVNIILVADSLIPYQI